MTAYIYIYIYIYVYIYIYITSRCTNIYIQLGEPEGCHEGSSE